jgi:HTH domain.
MRLMTGSVNFTVDELAEKMDTSYRTIYRYIDTFKDAGFAVEKVRGNIYRIMKMPKTAKDLEKLVYFSEEEARLPCRNDSGSERVQRDEGKSV